MMKFDDHTYEVIENYLDGVLDKHEMSSFEQRLKEDPELVRALQVFQEMRYHLGSDASMSLPKDSSLIKKYTAFFNSDEAKSYAHVLKVEGDKYAAPRSRYIMPYIAAAVLILISFSIAVLLNTDKSSDLTRYYAWNELPSFVERSDSQSELVKAEAFFKEKNYEQALTLFQSQLDGSAPNADVFIYAGVCQYELERKSEALITFDRLLLSDLLDSYKAHWYKALVYLSMDEKEKTRTELELLLNDEYVTFDKEARKLLDELKD